MALGSKLFRTVDRLLTTTDRVLDRVRKTPRKRLDEVPEPIEAPDPFVVKAADPDAVARVADAKIAAAASTAGKGATSEAEPVELTPPVEAPLGDVAIAAQIYGKRSDMWSGRAVRLFQDLGIEARYYDLNDPDHLGLEMRLVRDTKQYEMPWVYLRGEFIGGYNALDEISRLGKLEERTLPPGEKLAVRKGRVRVDTPPAPSEKPRSTGN